MIKKSCTKSQIFSKITEYHIFKSYCNNFKQINKKFFGDIGRTNREKDPSANIMYKNGKLIYHDFGNGITLSAIDYVMAKFNLSFQDALIKIDIDFGLGFSYNSGILQNEKYDIKLIKKPELIEKSRSVIRIKQSKWSDEDLRYWNSNGWTVDMLNAAKIVPVSSFYLKDNDGNYIRFNTNKELSYSYEYYEDNDGIFQRKIYRPNRDAKDGKWYSNVDTTTIQGWDLFPKTGEIGFIQSSFKDLGPTWRIFKEPVGLAPNTEGSFLPLNVWHKIKNRRKKWFLFFDNDEAGIKNAIKYSKIHGIKYIHMPIGGPKDPSDWVVKYGLRSFNYYLKMQLEAEAQRSGINS